MIPVNKIMTVFIVTTHHHYESEHITGVFASLGSAKKLVFDQMKQGGFVRPKMGQQGCVRSWDFSDFSFTYCIYEKEVLK